MSSVEQRLEKLERENRWLKAGALILVTAVGGAVFLAADKSSTLPVAEVISAKNFRLVDANGKRRGSWIVDKDGDAIFKMDGAGDTPEAVKQRSVFIMCGGSNSMMGLRHKDRSAIIHSGEDGNFISVTKDGVDTSVYPAP